MIPRQFREECSDIGDIQCLNLEVHTAFFLNFDVFVNIAPLK